MLDILLRGAAAGLLLLVSLKFFRPTWKLDRHNLGALFALGTLAYVVVSAPSVTSLPPTIKTTLIVIATANSVFFWWFASALFDDNFRWTLWRLVPGASIAALVVLRLMEVPWVQGNTHIYAQNTLVGGMMLHAVWLAINERNNDLIERRRRFRVLFAGVVGMTGLAIAIIEIVLSNQRPAYWLSAIQAVAVFVLTFGFANWVFAPVDVLTRPASAPEIADPQDPQDGIALRRLETTMREGAYRQEGLTIGKLAQDINFPEYRLRRLINQSLGYRNFNAFLNQYRIAAAKEKLADPTAAQAQITQIALELGYASIAPFNRAFRESVGTTPTNFRKDALKAILANNQNTKILR